MKSRVHRKKLEGINSYRVEQYPPHLIEAIRRAEIQAAEARIDAWPLTGGLKKIIPSPNDSVPYFSNRPQCSFTVHGKVVGTNAAYKRSGSTTGRVGFYMTEEAKVFKGMIFMGAIKARERANPPWPLDYEGPIVLTYKTFNCRQDVDSPGKLIQDALQGVFYVNDKQVMKLTAEKAKDDKGPRVEITVEMI